MNRQGVRQAGSEEALTSAAGPRARPAQEAADPLIGAMVLGRYRVGRKLGEGGMGAVYEAENVLLGRRVAIKCLLPRFSLDAEVVARFVREAQAATLVQHEHIVDVYDLDVLPDGTRFMVLELLEGADLEVELERRTTLPLARTIDIAVQICDALAAAHRAGVVHRDLKTANVFLVRRAGRDDFVKVVDFGIARLLEAQTRTGKLTRTGTVLGTPYSMAPEQVEARKDVDGRADVYALGVLIFECLAGRPPFHAESYGELVVQIARQPAPALRSLRPDLPAALESLVARMLAKAPADRPATFDDVRAELEAIGASARASAPVGSATAARSSPPAPGSSPALAWSAPRASVTTERTRRSGVAPWVVAAAGLGALSIALGAGLYAWAARPRSQAITAPSAQGPAAHEAGQPSTQSAHPTAAPASVAPAAAANEPVVAPVTSVLVTASPSSVEATSEPATDAARTTEAVARRRPARGRSAPRSQAPAPAPAPRAGGRGLITSLSD